MLQRISIHRASNSLTHRCTNRKDAFCNEGTPHAHAIRNSIRKEEDEGWWVSEWASERESRMRAREKRKRELRRQLKYLVKRAMNRITVRTVLTKYRQCYVCLCLHVSGRKEKNFPVFPIFPDGTFFQSGCMCGSVTLAIVALVIGKSSHQFYFIKTKTKTKEKKKLQKHWFSHTFLVSNIGEMCHTFLFYYRCSIWKFSSVTSEQILIFRQLTHR